MTAAEMVILFEERYNLSSNTNQEKTDDEIYLYLNNATDSFINNRFTGNNPARTNFESTEKGIDDIRTLITTSPAIPSISTSIPEYPNGASYAIPTDYRFGQFASVLLNDLDGDGSADFWQPCDRVSTEEAKEFIQQGRNIPIIDKPKVFFTNPNEFVVLYDTQAFASIGEAKWVYIANPAIIGAAQDSNLPIHTHTQIVELAVLIAVEGVESVERFQTQAEQLKTKE